MENRDNATIEIDIKQIFFLLLSKAGYILLTGVVLAVLTFTYFKCFVPKTYTSTSQIYVINKTSDNLTSSDVSVSTYLSNDYVVLITTRPVMEQVISELDLGMTTGELAGMVNASVVTNSRMIKITVTDTSPIRAKRIVDCIAKVSATRICEIMDSEMVNIAEEGAVATAPVGPASTRNAVIAFILGAFMACAVIVIRFIMDDRIKTTDDIERYLGISVLGSIPVFEMEDLSLEQPQQGGKSSRPAARQAVARQAAPRAAAPRQAAPKHTETEGK